MNVNNRSVKLLSPWGTLDSIFPYIRWWGGEHFHLLSQANKSKASRLFLGIRTHSSLLITMQMDLSAVSCTLCFVNTCHPHSSPLSVCVWCDRSSVPCLGTTRLSVSLRNRLSGCTKASSPALPNRCVTAHDGEQVRMCVIPTCLYMIMCIHLCFFKIVFSVCVGDGASVCAGAAAGVCPERQWGGRGGPDGQTDPQRSQRLKSCEWNTTLFCVCVCDI